MKKQSSVSQKRMKAKKPSCSFGFVRIEAKDVFISDHHELVIGQPIKYNLAIDLTADYDKSYLLITIKCQFALTNGVEIMSLTVDNEFEISDIKQHIVNKHFVNKTFIQFLTELSLDHARGIQGNLINNTKLNRLFIPPSDLSQIGNEPVESK